MNIFLIEQKDGKYTLIIHDTEKGDYEKHYNLCKACAYAMVSTLMDAMMQEA